MGKITPAIIILLFLFSSTYAEFVIIESIQQPTLNNCKTLADITSQTNDNFNDQDLSTIGHERLHGLHSELRQELGGNFHCYYLLNNYGFIVRNPEHLRLSQLANSIPERYRGQVYNLYLIKSQKYWNDIVVYPLDEWTAYIAGTLVALELGDYERAEDSFFRALELNIYSIYLKRLANQPDITEFVDFQTARSAVIYNMLPKQNPKVIQNVLLLQEVINGR